MIPQQMQRKAKMNRRPFFVIDFETGGLDAQQHDPVQVAVQVLDGLTLQPVDHFVSYIRPDPSRISPEALKINNLNLEFLAEAPSSEDAFAALLRFLEPFGQGVFVAHNVKFDHDFFQAWAKKSAPPGFKFSKFFDYHLLCTAQMAFQKLVLQDQLVEKVKLTEITAFFKIPHNAHDALGDVVVTAEVFRRCFAQSFWRRLGRGFRLAFRTRSLRALQESIRAAY